MPNEISFPHTEEAAPHVPVTPDTWTALYARVEGGSVDRRTLLGHVRLDSHTQRIRKALRRLRLTVETADSVTPDSGSPPVIWQLIVHREGNEIEIRPLEMLPDVTDDRMHASSLLRPPAGEVVIEIWRFAENWGRWEATSFMPEIFRGPDMRRLEAIAGPRFDTAGGLGAVQRTTRPPLGARAQVTGEVGSVLRITTPGTHFYRDIFVEPGAEESTIERVTRGGYEIVARWNVRPDEPQWTYDPDRYFGRPFAVFPYGQKIRIRD